MPIFSHKKNSNPSAKVSRIPFADFDLVPYSINPKTEALSYDLNELLKEILDSDAKCLDGQNGNVFDNLIEDWENRAKASLSTQRAERIGTIANLASSRFANYQNALDWIERDTKELKRINDEIEELTRIKDENIFD